jgi:hypothetical protein
MIDHAYSQVKGRRIHAIQVTRGAIATFYDLNIKIFCIHLQPSARHAPHCQNKEED